MFRYIQHYRFYIALGLFVLIPLLSMDTTHRSPRDYRFYDKIITSLTFPVQNILSWGLDQLTWGLEKYLYLVHTHSLNLALLEENKKLLNAVASFREIEQENLRLQKFLRYESEFKFKSVVARVIARDISSEFQSIRINRGSQAGIQKDMAVITPEGVVGRILRTTEKTSDIVTLIDLLSAVDAIVQRSRTQGIIEGKSGNTCQMKYVLRTDDIQTGDILVSSGLGGIFPKGILIGTVSQIQKKNYGISQEVEVQPSIDFSKLEEVLVILNKESYR